MILTAVGIFYNLDRKFQAYVLEVFPQYGVGLTKFEDNSTVGNQLNKLRTLVPSLSTLAPDLVAGGQWFNLPAQAGSPPLKLEELRGKVVLVDFWTYTCINCVRTLPYMRAWDEKYRNKGLVNS